MARLFRNHLQNRNEHDIIGITVADDSKWALSSLAQRIATHRQSLSDARISCRGIRFRPHRLVLAAHSAILKELCESTTSQHGLLELSLDSEPLIAIKAMVDYFYSLRYALPKIPLDYAARIPEDFLPPASIIHAMVFQLAVKYDLSHLGNLVVARFEGDIDICTIGFLYERDITFGAGKIDSSDFTKVVKYVYEQSSAHAVRLKHALVRSILVPDPDDHRFGEAWFCWSDCTGCEASWTARDLRRVLEAVPAFASDLLATITGRSDHGQTDITLEDLRVALSCGKTSVEELRAVDEPPQNLGEIDDAED